jgi:hypothetical protein
MSPIPGHPFLADLNCDGDAAAPSPFGVKLAVAGDFDGDGQDELVVVPDLSGTGGNDLWAMKFDLAARRWEHMSPIPGHPFLADLNCDDGAAVPSSFGVKLVVAGDFDGDRREELIVAPDLSGTGGNDLWAMKFDPVTRRWSHMSPIPGHPFLADLTCDDGAAVPARFGIKFAVAGDFDGDGRDELIVAPDLSGTGGNDLWAMKFDRAAPRWVHMSPIPGHPFLADVNCDSGSAPPSSLGAKLAVAGHFTGDRRADLVVANDGGMVANDLWVLRISRKKIFWTAFATERRFLVGEIVAAPP